MKRIDCWSIDWNYFGEADCLVKALCLEDVMEATRSHEEVVVVDQWKGIACTGEITRLNIQTPTRQMDFKVEITMKVIQAPYPIASGEIIL